MATAAEQGDAALIAQCLREGADCDGHGYFGVTPLMWALGRDSEAGVRALLEQGADPNVRNDDGDNAVILAAAMDNPVFLRLALEHGGDANSIGARLITPLIAAALTGQREQVQLLIDSSADIQAKDLNGWTALDYARRLEYAGIVELLAQ